MGGPLMKRLAYKLGTRPPPMNPVLLSTTLQHRCNSAVGLQFAGAMIAVAPGAESGDQPGARTGPTPGKESMIAKSGCS